MRTEDLHPYLLGMSQVCYCYINPHSFNYLLLAQYEIRTHIFRLQNGCITIMQTGLNCIFFFMISMLFS